MTDSITQTVDNTDAPTDVSHRDRWVGEGKKYSTDEELGRAYTNASMHINELRDEIRELRADKSMSQELLDELRNPARKTGEVTTPSDNVTSVPPQTQPVDVKQVVQEAMSEAKSLETAQANTAEALRKLTEVYGTQAAAFDAVRAYTGGQNDKKRLVDDLGASDPEALVTLITSKTPVTTTAEPNTPGIKNDPSANTVLSVDSQLTWTECRRIKKEDPNLYHSPAFRAKIEAAVAAKGDEFYNT
jgi:hypothetical protein